MHKNNSILLSTAYFAPVSFYVLALKYEFVYVEKYENFSKQTFRNRCVILGANGSIPLVIPVVKGRGPKTLIKDLKISYDVDWQRNHWRTIFSAYNSSPFFEYYRDDIFPFFQNKEKFLLDLNMKINTTVCDLLEIENNLILTDDFEKVPENTLNLRETISPKNKTLDTQFQTINYSQVFSEKLGFTPNLSIMDLLFNEGPNSISVLEESGFNIES